MSKLNLFVKDTINIISKDKKSIKKLILLFLVERMKDTLSKICSGENQYSPSLLDLTPSNVHFIQISGAHSLCENIKK